MDMSETSFGLPDLEDGWSLLKLCGTLILFLKGQLPTRYDVSMGTSM